MATTREAGGWMEAIEEPDARKIFEALADDRWDFRTIDGLSTSTGLPEDRIRELLMKYPSLVRQSLVLDRQGRELYTLASRWPSLQEVLTNIRAVISKSTSTG